MRMRVFTFRAPERELAMLDALVKAGLYRSRSEAIRAAIRRLLEEVVL
jgi:Arc/MetJ-type ribon-helix-helix transcriptional regulator